MNGRPKRDGNGKTLRQRHDAMVFSGVVETVACEPTIPRSRRCRCRAVL